MRAQNAELKTTRLIAEAALIIAIFTAMAFQYIRFEVYETEKNAIVGILAFVILGANLIEFIQRRQFPRLRNPLTLAVLAFVLVGAVSTIFSLSPAYSFWGSPTRGHGLVMLFFYLLLFWQATRSAQRLNTALLPILTMTAIGVSTWAMFDFLTRESPNFQPIFRPVSTAGNPNYLAGWLVMFMAVYALMVYYRVSRWERPWQRRQMIEAGVYAFVLVLVFATFFILSSRGALAGFVAAFVTGVTVFLSYYRRRAILIGALALVLVGGGVYGVLSERTYQQLLEEGRDENFAGYERLLVIYDDSRVSLWEAAIRLLQQQAEPFINAEGAPDQWAFLRPALGYGMETLEQTQSRFGEDFDNSRWGVRYVERFHNLFYDWLAETGSLGLLTLIIVYESAFYIGMRYLGFINQEKVWYWLGLQLLLVPVGVFVVSRAIYQADWVSLIPLGVALAIWAGTMLWMVITALRTPRTEAEDGDNRLSFTQIAVIALLCVVSAQWVDNQFGFMQILSQTLFFILLGYLVGLSSNEEDVEAIEYDEADAIPESSYWFAGTLISGLFYVYGFGQAIDSNFQQAEIGINELPIFLAVILILGGGIGYLRRLGEQSNVQQAAAQSTSKKARRKAARKVNQSSAQPIWMILLAIVVVWVVFFGFKSILVQSASSNLNTALSSQPQTVAPTGVQGVSLAIPDAGSIRATYFLLSLNGVALILVALMALLWNLRGKSGFSLVNLGAAVTVIFLIGGFIFYSQNFTVSTMRQAANGFTSFGQEDSLLEPIVAADSMYDSASDTRPGDVKLRLGWVDSLITQLSFINQRELQLTLLERIEAETEAALDASPFFVNSRTWEVFNQRYQVLQQRVRTLPEPDTSSQQPPGMNLQPPGAGGPPDGLPVTPPFDPNSGPPVTPMAPPGQ